MQFVCRGARGLCRKHLHSTDAQKRKDGDRQYYDSHPEQFETDGERTSFDDALVTVMVDRALRDNLDLQTAWQRLREAEAVGGGVRLAKSQEAPPREP